EDKTVEQPRVVRPPDDKTVRQPKGAAGVAPQTIVVPDLGDFADVEVIDVLVKPGDEVTAEQGLVTLETEKASMDVPAPLAGTVLEVKVKKGSRVNAGDPVAVVRATATDAAAGGATAAVAPSGGAAPAANAATPAAAGAEKANESPTAASAAPISSRASAATLAQTPSAAPAQPRAATCVQPQSAAPARRRARAAPPAATSAAPTSFGEAHASPSVRKLARE